MGCACKTNQQISYLQRKYGDKQPRSVRTNIREMFSIGTKKVLIGVIIIPILPIAVIFLAIKHMFTKKPINIKKTFKINK